MHIEVTGDILCLLVLEHVLVEGYIVKILVVLLVFKVIYDGHLWWIVLQ